MGSGYNDMMCCQMFQQMDVNQDQQLDLREYLMGNGVDRNTAKMAFDNFKMQRKLLKEAMNTERDTQKLERQLMQERQRAERAEANHHGYGNNSYNSGGYGFGNDNQNNGDLGAMMMGMGNNYNRNQVVHHHHHQPSPGACQGGGGGGGEVNEYGKGGGEEGGEEGGGEEVSPRAKGMLVQDERAGSSRSFVH